MKKVFLCMMVLVLGVCSLSAQVVRIEQAMARAEKDSTEMERFVARCDLYSEEVFVETPASCGITGRAVIYTNLETNDRIGGIRLWDEDERNAYFGTMDFDEIDALLAVLRRVLQEDAVKHYGLDYKIFYSSKSGIGLSYNKGEIRFNRVWYYMNSNGVWCWRRVEGEDECNLKQISIIIEWLERSKAFLEKELAK